MGCCFFLHSKKKPRVLHVHSLCGMFLTCTYILFAVANFFATLWEGFLLDAN
jgi:hypothetical protein